MRRAAADSSSSLLRRAAATPSWIALPTGCSGSVTIVRARAAASRARCAGSLPLSSMVLLRSCSICSRPGPVAMYAPIATPMIPPSTNHPKPPPLLSSAIATSSNNRANQCLTRHPHAVDGRADAPAECREPAASSAQSDVDTRCDVVHVLDGLPHLGEGLAHLFIRRVEQLLDGAQCAAKPDEDRCEGQRHDQGGEPKRDPHEALAAHRLNTPHAPAANTPAIVSALCLVPLGWFFGFAVQARHEPRQGLQEQGKDQGRNHV